MCSGAGHRCEPKRKCGLQLDATIAKNKGFSARTKVLCDDREIFYGAVKEVNQRFLPVS
jgi:hypothetical protein